MQACLVSAAKFINYFVVFMDLSTHVKTILYLKIVWRSFSLQKYNDCQQGE